MDAGWALVVLSLLVAQILLPAIFLSVLLRRTGLAAEEITALALALAPVVTGIAVVTAVTSPLGRYLLAALLLGAAIGGRRRLGEVAVLLRQRVTALLGLTILFWGAQEALIVCHGHAYYLQDWQAHFNVAGVITGWMREGFLPIIPQRTAWLGVWTAPALMSVPTYGTFQLATVFAHSLALPVVYLWGRRMGGGARDGERAWLVALACAGFTFSALYTWPKVFAAQLMLLAMYLYTHSVEATDRTPRLAYALASGLVWAIAFQAHQYTIAYAVAFFAAAWLLPRRYPWAAALVFATIMAVWWWKLATRFPTEWWGTPYFDTRFVTLGRQWEYFTTHLRSTFVPSWFNAKKAFADPDPFLRETTDVLLMTLPVVVTVAVPLAAWRCRWRHADVIIVATLAAGGLGTLWLLEGAGVGIVQASLAPALLWLCALGGAASRHLWPPLARALCTLSVVQYVVFRSFQLVMNVTGADAANLRIKEVAQMVYLGDEWSSSVTLAIMLLAGVALLVWNERLVVARSEKSA